MNCVKNGNIMRKRGLVPMHQPLLHERMNKSDEKGINYRCNRSRRLLFGRTFIGKDMMYMV